MKKEYIKPEIDLIDLLARESMMSIGENGEIILEDNDVDFGLSDNIWDE